MGPAREPDERRRSPAREDLSRSQAAALAAPGARECAHGGRDRRRVLPGGADVPPPGSPVTQAEVERLARSFAAAYKTEDAERIGNIVTSDAQRVLPDNRQKGRADVVAAYASQFAASQNSSYELSDIEVSGGPVGRLTARYRTGSATVTSRSPSSASVPGRGSR